MLGAILQLDDLRAITGYQHMADIERCLQRQSIRYFYGRKGVLWTTLDLVNAAGGLRIDAPANDGGLSPDLLG